MYKVLVLLTVFFACCQTDYTLTSSGVIIDQRLYSPDSTYVALSFHRDNGAMGESQSLSAVLQITDTLKSIAKYTLPCFDLDFYPCYYPSKWLGNRTLQVFLNERPFIKKNIPFPYRNFKFNAVNMIVVPYDISNGKTALLQNISVSDDGKKLLVAYTYGGDLNISAIKYNDTLPRIGNLFTNYPISWNPIKYGGWKGSAVELFLVDNDKYEKNDYLNQNIQTQVFFSELPRGAKTWKEQPLYTDTTLDQFLDQRGENTIAKIDAIHWQRTNGQGNTCFEYSYGVKNRHYKSSFRIYDDSDSSIKFSVGDSFQIVFDREQPIVHRVKI